VTHIIYQHEVHFVHLLVVVEDFSEEREEVSDLLRFGHDRKHLGNYLSQLAHGRLGLMRVVAGLKHTLMALLPNEDHDLLELTKAVLLERARELHREVGRV
jgi:hypothetical protein